MDPYAWRPNEANFKPPRGTTILQREEARLKDETAEHTAIVAAKRRDHFKCRWPEPHKCRGFLEGAHIVDKSLGGANATENIVSLCSWTHRRGPQSIHGKQYRIEKETPKGANSRLSFWKQDGGHDAQGHPTYFCVGRESSPGICERD